MALLFGWVLQVSPVKGQEEAPRYHTVDEIEAYLQDIVADHPDLAKLESLGKTVEGRDIWALKLSDHPQLIADGEPGSEPAVLYVGVHHANEWLGAEVLLYYLDHLLANYGADSDGQADEDPDPARATWLVNNRELYFVMVLNPDGMAYDMAQGPQGGDWRKNREPNPDGSYGTDLNRNYPWHWGEPGVNDPNPRSDFYEGPPDLTDNDGDGLVDEDKVDGADNDGDGEIDEDRNGGFSTRETQAMRELVERENFTMAVSYHTAGNQILFPWGYTTQSTPEDDLFRALAGDMAAMNGYEVMQGSELYPTAGEFTDWLYGSHHVYGFTLELADQAGGDEYVDPAQIEPISRLNLPVNLYLAERAANPQGAFDPATDPPVLELMESPAKAKANQPFTVTIRAATADGVPLTNASLTLHYQVTDDSWTLAERLEGFEGLADTFRSIELIEVEPGFYEGAISGQEGGRHLYFYATGQDDQGHEGYSPLYAPYGLHHIVVAENGSTPGFTLLFNGPALLLGLVISGFIRAGKGAFSAKHI